MNSKVILCSVAAVVAALGSVMALKLTKTPTASPPTAQASAQKTAFEQAPKSATTVSGEKLVASSAPAPGPTPAQQNTTRPEPAPTQGPAAARTQAGPSAFGGTWVLDRSRSEGLPAGMDQLMTVTPSGDGINIETQLTSPRGAETVREGYTLNGQEVGFASKWAGGADSKGTRVARLTAEGRGIEVTEQATVSAASGPMTAEITRSWSLSADGKNLTIKTVFKSPAIIYDNLRLFVRK